MAYMPGLTASSGDQGAMIAHPLPFGPGAQVEVTLATRHRLEWCVVGEGGGKDAEGNNRVGQQHTCSDGVIRGSQS